MYRRWIAACAAAWLQLAAAHPHPGLDDLPHEPYVAPPLARAFEAAWKLSAESVQGEGHLLRAEAEREAAMGLLAGAATVELDHNEGRGGGATSRESEAGVVLPLWMPGQRRTRTSWADAELARAEASLHAARLRVAGTVRERAWAVLAAEAELAALRSHLDTLRTLSADVERRVKAGDLPRADAMAAQAEMHAAAASSEEAAARLDEARARWAVLTGVPPPTEAGEADPGTAAVEDHPDILLARAEVVRARRHLDFVKASRRDPPEVTLRVRREQADVNLPAGNGVGIGVRVPLGGAVRNAARDAEAVAALENARAEERRIVARLESEVRTARARLESARRALQATESRAALLLERAALVERSFRAGETPLPELLRTRDASAQAQAAAARQNAELGLARARLLTLLGKMP